MKQQFLLILLIASFALGCSPKIGPSIHYFKQDGEQWYTSKIYGYLDGKRTLVQIDTYKRQTDRSDLYDLKESVLFYEQWPNNDWKFVSAEGFTTFKDGVSYIKGDSVPDNVIFTMFNKGVEEIYYYKDGQRVPYTLGRPDGYQVIYYLREKPGIYNWKDGQEYLEREFTPEEIENHKTKAEKWEDQAALDKRLLPKYGHLPKSEDEIKADEIFIETVLKVDSSRRKASDQLIRLGFDYLKNDLKTAMYRFNQAYLLDSANTDLYWGYGAVYMQLKNYKQAQAQYLQGLSIDPQNTHLLTDYGTFFLERYYNLRGIESYHPLKNLDTAITYLSQSYQLDPSDQNTVIKLSICYWNQRDCENAWKFYRLCKALGGETITEEYTKDLKKKCQ